LRETVDVDGIQLGPLTDYLQLVREQLKDGSIWPDDAGPEEGLWRAIDASSGTAVHRRLLDAIQFLLKDPDVEVRTRAIAMTHNYPGEIDPFKVVALLREYPQLYEGVKPEGVSESYMPDLAWGLIQTLTANPKATPEAIALLRKATADPKNGFRVLGGLAAKDPDWVIEHAHRLVAEQPVRARIVLPNLTTPQRRERFIEALSGEPAAFRRELVDVIGEEVKNPNERQRLTALLG
jgi:hypothetical protein